MVSSKRVLAAVLTTGSVALMGPLTVGSASAAVTKQRPTVNVARPLSASQCPVGHFCFWTGASATGYYNEASGTFSFEEKNLATSPHFNPNINDQISSVWNRSKFQVRVCTAADLGGYCSNFFSNPNGSVYNLLSDLNNQISSFNAPD